MDLDDLNLDIKIEVTSIEELREIRKEMQKIAKAKKEIDASEKDTGLDPLDPVDIPDTDPDPDPFYPDYPKRDFPHFVIDTDTKDASFETSTELASEEVKDAADAVSSKGLTDEEFTLVGQMSEDKFNDRRL